MAFQTETDQLLTVPDKPVAVLTLLFSDGRVAPLPRDTAPMQAVTVTTAGLLIGREIRSSQGIPLPVDRKTSARHAKLWLHEDGQVLVEDLGSKNGTFLNGQKVGRSVVPDRSILRVGNSLFLLRFVKTKEPLRRPANLTPQAEELLRGTSVEIDELRHQLALAAERDAPVLLLGETGTGKERAAKLLHLLSPRQAGPYRSLNCATIPSSLAGSTLFGHVAGAFTGAQRGQSGIFRQAQGGTLFLDEIGELPEDIQPMLLRALEEGVIWPIGATEPLSTNARIIAATNRDLEYEVSHDSFRGDLLARLSVLRIRLPTLAARKEDILPLFLHYAGSEKQLTARLAEALLLFPWPRNVRQLISVAEHANTYGDPGSPFDLPTVEELLAIPVLPLRQNAAEKEAALPSSADNARANASYDDQLLKRLLREEEGLIARVARRMNLSRRQIGRVLKQKGIDPSRYRKGSSGDKDKEEDNAEDEVEDKAEDNSVVGSATSSDENENENGNGKKLR